MMIFLIKSKSYATTTFKAEKGGKDIIKIVHVIPILHLNVHDYIKLTKNSFASLISKTLPSEHLFGHYYFNAIIFKAHFSHTVRKHFLQSTGSITTSKQI